MTVMTNKITVERLLDIVEICLVVVQVDMEEFHQRKTQERCGRGPDIAHISPYLLAY